MIFRLLRDLESSTHTYLLGDPWSREAVLIDPVRSQIDRDLGFVHELGLKLVFALDTHVHADHVTASGLLRARTGCEVVIARAAGAEGADRQVEDGDAIRFGLQALEVRATPGHTEGCVTYVTADRGHAFTGDALLVRGCGRTDFQGGDARTLYRSIQDKVFSLPDDTLIHPAHDYQGRTLTSVREERLYNPRLREGTTEDAFVAIMAGLDLAQPRLIHVAVPANRVLGLTEPQDAQPPGEDSPVRWPAWRTPTGAPNLPALWVADALDAVHLVDVRTIEEWNGPLGHLPNAEHAPLESLLAIAARWDREHPTVLYCRSGGRSDKAAIELERSGFTRVASMAGGILKWAALGLPIADGTQG